MQNALALISQIAGRAAMDALLKGRAEQKRQILFDELAAGKISMLEVINKDDLSSCIYQYEIASMKGAADYKLKLMARVLRGQLEGGVLIPDEFLSNSEMIASLREEEIKLIATLYRIEQAHIGIPDWSQRVRAVMLAVSAALIPKVFADIDTMNSIAVATQKKGLILYANMGVGGEAPDNLVELRTTSRMAKFAEIARFETLGLDY
jgi:hypothetical protein